MIDMRGAGTLMVLGAIFLGLLVVLGLPALAAGIAWLIEGRTGIAAYPVWWIGQIVWTVWCVGVWLWGTVR